MGRHSDNPEGHADDWTGCSGENRGDPDSWDDPAIAGPTEPPTEVEPIELNERGEVPPCS